MRSRFALGCLILVAVGLWALTRSQELHQPEITDPALAGLPVPNLDAPVFVGRFVGRADGGGYFAGLDGFVFYRAEDFSPRPPDLTAWGAGYATCGVLLSHDFLPAKDETPTIQRTRPVVDGWLRPTRRASGESEPEALLDHFKGEVRIWATPGEARPSPLSGCYSGGGLGLPLPPPTPNGCEELWKANWLNECFPPDRPIDRQFIYD
jgi:hypothetical protein